MQNGDYSWRIPNYPDIYVKETIGPYTQAESKLNPLKALERALRPNAGKIYPFFIIRDPLDSWLSWLENWGKYIEPEILLKNFITAHHTTQEIRLEAVKGYEDRVTHYVYLANTNPKEAFSALFNRLGIDEIPRTSKWDQKSKNVYFPENKVTGEYDIPEIFKIMTVSHSNALNTDGIIHYVRDHNKITSEYRRLIEDEGLLDFYGDCLAQCQKDLNLAL